MWVNQHQKGKPFWILLKQNIIAVSRSSWSTWKLFAPHSRHITTPVPQQGKS